MEGSSKLNKITSPLVLMYHAIMSSSASIPNNRETGAKLYDVTVTNFKSQMELLKKHGYHAETLEKRTQGQKIIITFDDGEMNNFQEAFPILKELGWQAYFFIIVKRIGENGYLGWPELRKLAESGMIVGSHGLSHEVLTNLLDSQMEEELRASKSTLEINLGMPIDTFSIPRGFCNDKVIQKAYELGYKTVFISERPASLKSPCLSRVAVKASWSLKRFEMAIKGKTPFIETIGNLLKKVFKTIFRESGYNLIRKMLIHIMK
jgi:peptidoglycan/xylan/chitin deacetylase (PgdA/CDA1 family)